MLNFINGGVCAAQGFKAAGVHMGVKSHKTDKKDVALIVSDVECSAAAVFTKNAVKAAPIHVDKEHLKNGKARAIIVNSGNANACAPRARRTPSACASPPPRPLAARRRTFWCLPPVSSVSGSTWS